MLILTNLPYLTLTNYQHRALHWRSIKKMKNSHENLHAINCRIPQKTADEMATLLEVTSKSIAIFVRDAIETYMAAVKSPGGSKPNPLKIDQFAWQLKAKQK